MILLKASKYHLADFTLWHNLANEGTLLWRQPLLYSDAFPPLRLPVIYGNVPALHTRIHTHGDKKRFVLDRIWPDDKSASFYFTLIRAVRIPDPYSVTGLRWTLRGVCFPAPPDTFWPFVHLFQPQWASQSAIPSHPSSHTHTHCREDTTAHRLFTFSVNDLSAWAFLSLLLLFFLSIHSFPS